MAERARTATERHDDRQDDRSRQKEEHDESSGVLRRWEAGCEVRRAAIDGVEWPCAEPHFNSIRLVPAACALEPHVARGEPAKELVVAEVTAERASVLTHVQRQRQTRVQRRQGERAW